MTSLDKTLSEKIRELRKNNLLREPRTTERLKSARIKRNGRKLISFSCNDYLGLAQDERLKAASVAATRKYGVGSGASRLITGNTPLYEKLEKSIANICNAESAIVFGSGYTANIGAITALVGSGDLVIIDKLSHSCIIEGAKLSGAEFKRFLHNDLDSIKNILKKSRKSNKNCLVVTESVFSMDGDAPDIKKLLKLCNKYDAWLLVDHAHDLDPLTKITSTNIIKMGTLSKAIGSYGGYIAGSKTLIDYLKSVSRTCVYTTGLPPAVLAASLKSLEIISKEKWRAKKAIENANYFRKQLSKKLDELETGSSDSQIVPVIIGGIEETIRISEHLYKQGFLVSAIRPPTVPVNTSRLRFSFSAAHEKKDIDKLVKSLISYYK